METTHCNALLINFQPFCLALIEQCLQEPLDQVTVFTEDSIDVDYNKRLQTLEIKEVTL